MLDFSTCRAPKNPRHPRKIPSVSHHPRSLVIRLLIRPGYQFWICNLGQYLPPNNPPMLYGSSTVAPDKLCRPIAMKNSSRAKCRGSYCGSGKPGFWHQCLMCGKRFCPKCVRPLYRHACTSLLPSTDPNEGESEPIASEATAISRSEL